MGLALAIIALSIAAAAWMRPSCSRPDTLCLESGSGRYYVKWAAAAAGIGSDRMCMRDEWGNDRYQAIWDDCGQERLVVGVYMGGFNVALRRYSVLDRNLRQLWSALSFGSSRPYCLMEVMSNDASLPPALRGIWHLAVGRTRDYSWPGFAFDPPGPPNSAACDEIYLEILERDDLDEKTRYKLPDVLKCPDLYVRCAEPGWRRPILSVSKPDPCSLRTVRLKGKCDDLPPKHFLPAVSQSTLSYRPVRAITD
jgi:hypothetical protein